MMRHRKGMGLIEVVMAMAIGMVLLVVLAVTVGRVIQANGQTRQGLQAATSLSRLGEQLRRDAHQSQGVALANAAGEPRKLVFAADANRPIEYEITPDGLERIVRGEAEPTRREQFVLPGMKPLGWKIDAERDEVSLVVGILARSDIESDAVRARFLLTAAVGTAEPKHTAP